MSFLSETTNDVVLPVQCVPRSALFQFHLHNLLLFFFPAFLLV